MSKIQAPTGMEEHVATPETAEHQAIRVQIFNVLKQRLNRPEYDLLAHLLSWDIADYSCWANRPTKRKKGAR